MRKLFIVSDVHSYFNEMIQALSNAGFDRNNPNHIFVSLGDLLDRGKQSIECLEFVNSLPDDRKILIKGNHEDCALDAIKRGYFRSHDWHNMTTNTFYDLVHGNAELQLDKDGLPINDSVVIDQVNHDPSWNKYINSCRDYYENNEYIFVHGWIPYTYNDSSTASIWRDENKIYDPEWKSGDWKDARWLNGFQLWREGIKHPEKTIICGHYHTSYAHTRFHKVGIEYPIEYLDTFWMTDEEVEAIMNETMHTEPFYDDGIIGIDACTAISGKVNCIVLQEG